MQYLITFHTHSGAIKYRKYCRELGLTLKLKPVPRRISSNCGVAGTLITEIDILEHTTNSIEGIYQVEVDQYNMIYKND